MACKTIKEEGEGAKSTARRTDHQKRQKLRMLLQSLKVMTRIKTRMSIFKSLEKIPGMQKQQTLKEKDKKIKKMT